MFAGVPGRLVPVRSAQPHPRFLQPVGQAGARWWRSLQARFHLQVRPLGMQPLGMQPLEMWCFAPPAVVDQRAMPPPRCLPPVRLPPTMRLPAGLPEQRLL